jgi:hypothetical protein
VCHCDRAEWVASTMIFECLKLRSAWFERVRPPRLNSIGGGSRIPERKRGCGAGIFHRASAPLDIIFDLTLSWKTNLSFESRVDGLVYRGLSSRFRLLKYFYIVVRLTALPQSRRPGFSSFFHSSLMLCFRYPALC